METQKKKEKKIKEIHVAILTLSSWRTTSVNPDIWMEDYDEIVVRSLKPFNTGVKVIKVY